MHEQHKTHCVSRSKRGCCSYSHACISSSFVGIGTGPELEQNYNSISIQWLAPWTWSPMFASSLLSFDLAMFYILHQMSVTIIEVCGQVYVLKTKKLKSDFCFTAREKMSDLGHFCLSDPHIGNQNTKSLSCETLWPQKTISTRQGWRLLPDLIFVVGPLHCFFFFYHFWHTNLRNEEEFF